MSEQPIRRDRQGRWSVHTETRIDAPAQVVWETIIDMAAMPNWTSVGLRVVEPFVAGRPVDVQFTMNRLYTMKMERVLTIVDGVSFEWSGPYMRGFSDHHVFRLEPVGNQTRFVQTDVADGSIGKRLGRLIMWNDLRLYSRWNAELRVEAERRATEREGQS